MSMFGRVLAILILCSLSACAKPPHSDVAIPERKKITPVTAPKKIQPPQVVILVSEDIPAYNGVAKSLGKLLGKRATVQFLSSNQLDNIKIIQDLKDDENIQIVSIGLNAANATRALADKQVIFCQVYNYQDYDLLSTRHKGVSMMPSFDKTFSTWRALSLNTIDIGVISGPGFDDVMQTAKIAAKAQGFRLHHETVNTDKEYQYAYKKLSRKVQGYWLLPDNRVLSDFILRDIMTYSVRNGIQVAVFSDELLKLGGLFSIQSDPKDVAQQVYERLEKAQGSDTISGPDIVNLEKIELRINSVMAKHLDIAIPNKIKKYANAP